MYGIDVERRCTYITKPGDAKLWLSHSSHTHIHTHTHTLSLSHFLVYSQYSYIEFVDEISSNGYSKYIMRLGSIGGSSLDPGLESTNPSGLQCFALGTREPGLAATIYEW